MKITVKIYKDDIEISSKVFSKGSYRAGRSEFCDIILEDDNISRSHLEIRVTDTSVYLTNMSGAGKLKLNNERVETGEIKDGDTIHLGTFKLVVFHGEREEAQPLEPLPAEEIPAASEQNQQNFLPEENQLQQEADRNILPFPEISPEEASPHNGVEGNLALKEETFIEVKPVVAKLVFTEGPRKGDELPLEAYEIIMGRSKKVDIFLDDEKLSRRHAKITRIGMGYRLIDLNSRNGTYVNGMRVLEHPLNSFDVVELGSTKIKFLIMELGIGDIKSGGLVSQTPGKIEDTKSLMIGQLSPLEIAELNAGGPGPSKMSELLPNLRQKAKSNPKLLRILALSLILILGLYFLIKPVEEVVTPAAEQAQTKAATVPASMSKEYLDLTPEVQRSIEGNYNSALKEALQENYEEALLHIKKIHDLVTYYKDSRERQEEYSRGFKAKQIKKAQEDGKAQAEKDLKLYLEDGVQYLKDGDFERAAEAFNSAIAMDPRNKIAIQGIRAAELKIRDIDKVPPERDAEQEKREQVATLFQQANLALNEKRYYEAIDKGEKIRKIELKNETQYLNEAKQLIDKAKERVREEFEPYLINAKEKYAEGDYNASRELCEEMQKKDPMFDEASECLAKAKKQLNRLAKEAYIHGYILESMNRLEEAKQYWNRAKNFVRPGDDYYKKVMNKLEQYQ